MSLTSARREIEDELARLEQRRVRLRAALDALAGLDGPGAAPPATGAGTGASGPTGPRPRAAAGATHQRILDHLREHPEDRGTAIAAALDLNRGYVNNALVHLKKTGRLHVEGKRLVPNR